MWSKEEVDMDSDQGVIIILVISYSANDNYEK